MQQQEVIRTAADRASRRKVALIVIAVAGVLLLYFSSLTLLSSFQLLDFGPSPGTISYAPDKIVEYQQIKLETGQAVTVAAFSFDGSLAATAGAGPMVELRHLPDGERIGTLDAGGAPMLLAFSPNGNTLVSATTDEIRVWDTTNSQPLYGPIKPNVPLKVVMVSSDGQRIQAAGTDGRLLIWQLVDGQQLLDRPGKLPALSGGAAFNEDGRVIAYADANRGVVLWSLEKDEEQRVFDDSQTSAPIVGIAFSHLGGLVAAQDASGEVHVFQTQSGKRVQTFRWAGPTASDNLPITASSFSADARLFALGGADGRIELWDVQKGELRATLGGEGAFVRGVGFTDDGRTMNVATGEGSVRLWHPNGTASS